MHVGRLLILVRKTYAELNRNQRNTSFARDSFILASNSSSVGSASSTRLVTVDVVTAVSGGGANTAVTLYYMLPVPIMFSNSYSIFHS